MNFAARIVCIALAVVGVGAIVFGTMGAPAPAEVKVPAHEAPVRATPAALKGTPVGMSGCLASACHGTPAERTLAGLIDGHTWASSGSCWAAADPHTAAYSLLTDHPHRPVKVTARHIMERYAPGTEAVNDARCVACHTNPSLAAPERFNDARAKQLRTEGVSCEACHGNAGGWVSDHTTWKGDRAEVYAKTGMSPLYDIGERALACAGCHVGAPAENGLPVRDMNHDMIAAGHPRLNFDFAEYVRRLPRHWQEKDRRANTDPLPATRTLNAAKEWLVGRAAHAEAACKLLVSRAERSASDDRTPWPEFAEFNCAACHHNLHAATDPVPEARWRKDPQNLHGRAPGAPAWQPIWPVTPAAGLDRPTDPLATLDELSRAMGTARPKREAILALARKSAEAMANRRRQEANTPDADAMTRARNLLPNAPPRVPEWDAAAQLFFGYAALERSRPGPSPLVPEFRKALGALRTDDWPKVKWAEVEAAFGAIAKKRP